MAQRSTFKCNLKHFNYNKQKERRSLSSIRDQRTKSGETRKQLKSCETREALYLQIYQIPNSVYITKGLNLGSILQAQGTSLVSNLFNCFLSFQLFCDCSDNREIFTPLVCYLQTKMLAYTSSTAKLFCRYTEWDAIRKSFPMHKFPHLRPSTCLFTFKRILNRCVATTLQERMAPDIPVSERAPQQSITH